MTVSVNVPVMIEMPQVPSGTAALIDRIDRRWTRTARPEVDGWENEQGGFEVFVSLLWAWGPLRVEFEAGRCPVCGQRIESYEGEIFQQVADSSGFLDVVAMAYTCRPCGHEWVKAV